jgi:glycosyltransferase involved in cell wall biosynthesis
VEHVGLNLIYLMPGRTGGLEIVARELIPALAAVAPQLRLTAFVNEETIGEPGPWRDVAEPVLVPVRASNRLDWVRGEQTLLPRMAARAGVELVHSLGATAPLWGRFRRVVTINDLTYKVMPETHTALYGRGLELLVSLGVRRAHRVIAISEATRADVVRLLHVAPERVDAVPLGLGAARVEPTPGGQLRERWQLPADRRLLLTFSDRRAHKNMPRLLEALHAMEERPLLAIAGYSSHGEDELRKRVGELGLAADVRLLPWVSDADREGLYALADAFVFPSLYEGFGLPVLEAMARGVPVACSNAASLPEVAGDAALTFDPLDVGAMRAAVELVLADAALIERLRAAGLQRAARFTWERTARLTLESYARA